MNSETFSDRALAYALKIVNKEHPACLYVRQACQRFIDDIERDDIYLHEDGERWCRFLEKLPHVKGKWAANHERLKLGDWQIFCTVNLFGWKLSDTHKRRFREAYIEVPRKNGKSFWTAGIGVGMLAIDNEMGAEVYCGATSEKQAWEIFRPAKQICERFPGLREKFGIEANARNLNIIATGSRFEPVIGNPGDGASPSCGIADEYHEHKSSDLVDTFVTGMGSREQPIMFQITTAGADMGGPCYEKRSDVIQILSKSVDDDRIFGIIYTIDEEDEWDTIDAQIKANPNYGISVDSDFLNGQLSQARRSATKQVAYKTKHLNQWVGAKSAWMNMLAFQACRKDITIEKLKGEKCIIGIDLASKTDIASMAIYFYEKGQVFFKHYLPEETILENARYKAWHLDGWLISTPGNVIDFGYIEDDLIDIKSDYQIVEVPYDPFQATQFSTRMIDQGFPMVEVGATVKNFSEPMKNVEAKILEKKITFQKDPVALWAFGNVVAKMDKKDNIYPNKEHAKNKIDPVVALIMAVNRSIHAPEEEYITGSMLTL